MTDIENNSIFQTNTLVENAAIATDAMDISKNDPLINGIGMLREIFAIAESNNVELCDSRERRVNSGYRTSQFYKERDSSDRVVAHYRVWTACQNRKVARTQAGFEKFSVKGELQDREVRYCEHRLQ